jgi:CubicO group peptidase (beta-lactamase class C family)
MTKLIFTVGALLLVEACQVRLDDPVDELLPELADRRVLVDALFIHDQQFPTQYLRAS